MNEAFNQRIWSVQVGKNATHAQIIAKRRLREELETEMEKFLAKGGEVETLDRSQYQTFRSPCFDKSIHEFQQLAIINKRKSFSYWCDTHGIAQFRSKNAKCIRCEVTL